MNPIEVVAASTDPVDLVRSKLQGDQEDPFYVVDLGRLHRLHHTWSAALPEVQPFYGENKEQTSLSCCYWIKVARLVAMCHVVCCVRAPLLGIPGECALDWELIDCLY